MSRVVAYVPDLMDRSKVAAAGEVRFVNRPSDLEALDPGVELVLVDLMRPGVLEVLPSISAPMIGFANHAERDVMDRASAAGCRVLARSAFFARLGDLLAT